MNKSGIITESFALFIPTYGTLGMRTVDITPATLDKDKRLAEAKCHTFDVSADRAQQLLEQLNTRYASVKEPPHLNTEKGMGFIHDPKSYHILNTCHDAIRKWLKQLDCRVAGTGVFTDYKIVQPRTPSQRTPR